MTGETKCTPFSDREWDVVRCLLEGKANKEIARELGIATRTVESHLTSIYSKLGVKSRSEAILTLSASPSWKSTRKLSESIQGYPQLKEKDNKANLSKKTIFYSYRPKPVAMKKKCRICCHYLNRYSYDYVDLRGICFSQTTLNLITAHLFNSLTLNILAS